MKLLCNNKHQNCTYYEQDKKPLIELVKIVNGNKEELSVQRNEIACIIEGRLRYFFNDMLAHEGTKGQLIFCTIGSNYAYEALCDSIVLIIRTDKPVSLCPNFSIEKLYGLKSIQFEPYGTHEMKHIGTLEMNSRIWHYLNGIVDCIGDGLRCRCWFELKVRELELLLCTYYTKEALHDFYCMILSRDVVFSENVRLNWRKYNSVSKLASFMHLTPKQFTTRFIRTFGQSPHRWMVEGIKLQLSKELTTTKKPLKQIISECGFASETQFFRFCKKEFGRTPSELRENLEGSEKNIGRKD